MRIWLIVYCFLFALPATAQETAQEILDIILKYKNVYDYVNADKYANLAIDRYPHDPVFYIIRAEVSTFLDLRTEGSLYKMPDEKYKQALADLKKALELNGDILEIYEIESRLHSSYQQHENALDSFTRLHDAAQRKRDDSSRVNAIFNRATIYQFLERHNEAIRDLEELIKLNPKVPDNYNNLAASYIFQKNYTKAHEILDRGLSIAPKHAKLRQNKAFTYIQENKYKPAVKILTQLIKEADNPQINKGRYYNNRGEAKMGLGKLKEALEDINESLKYYPENSYAFRNRGLLHLKMGKKDLACADFQTAEKYGFSLSYGDEVKELLKKHCK